LIKSTKVRGTLPMLIQVYSLIPDSHKTFLESTSINCGWPGIINESTIELPGGKHSFSINAHNRYQDALDELHEYKTKRYFWTKDVSLHCPELASDTTSFWLKKKVDKLHPSFVSSHRQKSDLIKKYSNRFWFDQLNMSFNSEYPRRINFATLHAGVLVYCKDVYSYLCEESFSINGVMILDSVKVDDYSYYLIIIRPLGWLRIGLPMLDNVGRVVIKPMFLCFGAKGKNMLTCTNSDPFDYGKKTNVILPDSPIGKSILDNTKGFVY
jgi:hypothetical protein